MTDIRNLANTVNFTNTGIDFSQLEKKKTNNKRKEYIKVCKIYFQCHCNCKNQCSHKFSYYGF